jgi:hypothetical protein
LTLKFIVAPSSFGFPIVMMMIASSIWMFFPIPTIGEQTPHGITIVYGGKSKKFAAIYVMYFVDFWGGNNKLYYSVWSKKIS